jgi:hypothetical protein
MLLALLPVGLGARVKVRASSLPDVVLRSQ